MSVARGNKNSGANVEVGLVCDTDPYCVTQIAANASLNAALHALNAASVTDTGTHSLSSLHA